MKKINIFLFALAAMVLSSCGGNTFTVNGTITETDLTNGAVVVMTDLFTNEADTTVIVDGTFTFTGEADNTTVRRVSLVTANKARNSHYCTFVPEKGVIEMNLDEAETMVFNGPVNIALSKYYGALEGFRDTYYASMEAIEDVNSEEGAAQAQAAYDTYMESMKALEDETFAANKDNAVALAVLVLQQKMYEFESVEEFDAFLEGAAEFVTTNSRIVKQRESLVALSNTAEGKMFVDFTGEAVDGSKLSLSDYVGKGQYVLVDFWASWCGPCRGEIPNLVNIHKNYASKGLVVLGVPVWDERPDTDVAIEELGIKYDQIYMGDDRTPTNLYGISGIPQIILFGPDGTIVKRNLRGAAIEEMVKSVLQ